MRTITQKQAEKWLDKLKSKNPQVYQEVLKALKKYDRSQNQHECYVSLSRSLFKESQMTLQINNYLEGANKFAIDIPYEKKFDSMMKTIKANNRPAFQKIIKIIQGMANENQNYDSSNNVENESRTILQHILGKLTEEEREVKEFIEKELQIETAQTIISKKNLDYLKGSKNHRGTSSYLAEEPKKRTKKDIEQYNQIHRKTYIEDKYQLKSKPFFFNSFSNINEEKSFLKKMEKKYHQMFPIFLKMVHLYTIVIISREEMIKFMEDFVDSKDQLQAFMDILCTREVDRRKWTPFRPLNDMEFQNAERATFSYVTRPETYPAKSSNCSQFHKQFLNFNWVSVPFGTEENFNIRIKNQYEMSLLKSEDEMYELDIYLNKLKLSLKLVKKIRQKIQGNEDFTSEEKTFIGLGILQIMFKNANKEQRQQIEVYIKTLPAQTYRLFEAKIIYQIDELKNLREINGKNQWTQICEKNFNKALNIRSAEFKRLEKQKLKIANLLADLSDRYRLKLKKQRNSGWKFQKGYECEILNTVQELARSQKFNNRKYPEIDEEVIQMKNRNKLDLLPQIILSFEDIEALNMTINYFLCYLHQAIGNELERQKCKKYIQKMMMKLLKKPIKFLKKLKENVYQETIQKLHELNLEECWEYEELKLDLEMQDDEDLPFFKKNSQKNESKLYFPTLNKNRQVFYSNENLFIFLRLLYTLYERIIKARERTDQFEIFEVIIHHSIKFKESSRLEESLSGILGQSSYLLCTLNKLADQLLKNIQILNNCSVMKQSWKLMNVSCEDIYYLLFSRFYKLNKTGNLRIIRFLFDCCSNLVYIKLMTEVQDNFMSQELYEYHQQNLEYYVSASIEDPKGKVKKCYQKNKIEYFAEESTGKLINNSGEEDVIANGNRRNQKDIIIADMKRALHLQNAMIGE